MSRQNSEEKMHNEALENAEAIRTDFEDYDINFNHDDASNDDFTEVIIEGRAKNRAAQGAYLENVVLASGVQALQSERFREKTRSQRAAQKALEELEKKSLDSLGLSQKSEEDEAVKTAETTLKTEENAFEEKAVDASSVEVQPKSDADAGSESPQGEALKKEEKKMPFQVDERDETSDKRRHHHYAKHSRTKLGRKWRRMKKWQKGIIIFLLLFLFLIITAVLSVYTLYNRGKNYIMSGTYAENFENVITVDGVDYLYNTDVTTIAFMGVDRETFGLEDDLVGTAGQNDVNMLVAIDTQSGKTDVIVLPRDTVVDVNKYSLEGDYMGTASNQLCLAYAYGDGAHTSCSNVITSMQRVTYGIPINTYVALNLEGISELTDAIGGVKLVCPNDYEDKYKKGEQITLHGKEAERFIRARTDDLKGDSERRERQIAFVRAYVSQAASLALKNPDVLQDLFDLAKEYTVSNLSYSRALYFGTVVLSNPSEIMSFDRIQSLRGELSMDDSGYAQTVLDEDASLKTILDVYYRALK